ncbi:MAG TPA: anthranilate phosphoribosyltransferase, partial [Verrucomicrobiae bacterium]|nr:anthranilate phosphoribosyltransferase [Verrucomicrobiae bacterium]
MLEQLTKQLAAANPLTDEQIRQSVELLADEKVSANVKADFLAAFAKKGESPEEIAAFARALRDKSIIAPIDSETRSREILDVVGTGGDRLGTINISTTAAIICSAAGVTVAKHGNRAVTSQAGSADVLEALGI